MTINNKRKRRSKFKVKTTSLVDKIREFQNLHDIQMYRLEMEARRKIEYAKITAYDNIGKKKEES